jgi:hypothetical protein
MDAAWAQAGPDAAFLLMLPEALMSISEGSFLSAMTAADDAHADHADDEPHRRRLSGGCEIHEMLPVAVVWRWGALILAGFCVVFTLDLVLDVTKTKLLRGLTGTPAAIEPWPFLLSSCAPATWMV